MLLPIPIHQTDGAVVPARIELALRAFQTRTLPTELKNLGSLAGIRTPIRWLTAIRNAIIRQEKDGVYGGNLTLAFGDTTQRDNTSPRTQHSQRELNPYRLIENQVSSPFERWEHGPVFIARY